MSLGGYELEEILREIEFLKKAPQLRAVKQKQELLITKLTADLAAKSEEICKFHAGQEQILYEIRWLVGVPREVVNKARMFDENVMSKAGEPNRQKIVTILCEFKFLKNKTLKLMKPLFYLETGN